MIVKTAMMIDDTRLQDDAMVAQFSLCRHDRTGQDQTAPAQPGERGDSGRGMHDGGEACGRDSQARNDLGPRRETLNGADSQ